jgi:hypothetical protein
MSSFTNPRGTLTGSITLSYSYFKINFPTGAYAVVNLGSLGVVAPGPVIQARMVLKESFIQAGGLGSDISAWLGDQSIDDLYVRGRLVNDINLVGPDGPSLGWGVCKGDPNDQDPNNIFFTITIGPGSPSPGVMFSTLQAGQVLVQVQFQKHS